MHSDSSRLCFGGEDPHVESKFGGRWSGVVESQMKRTMSSMNVARGVPGYPWSESYPLICCWTLSMATVTKWDERKI